MEADPAGPTETRKLAHNEGNSDNGNLVERSRSDIILLKRSGGNMLETVTTTTVFKR